MKLFRRVIPWCVVVLFLPAGARGDTNTNVHTTWLWHLHQPIYWPDRRSSGTDHYENAWNTIQAQNAGRLHPSPEVLTTIFGVADRVNAYQNEPGDTISGLLGYPDAGAQVNYSGALMENVQSLAAAGQLGYAAGWTNRNRTARGWTTSGGKPRLDLVNFTYHHALAPLVSDATLEMELRLQQRQMEIFWGTNPPLSRGYFPAETCFSESMIPVLNRVGIAWTVVANNHLTRACADFPLVTGQGGENCDLPNPADQINPDQGTDNYQRITIERGCSPSAAMPFAFQLHYARYVDPDTGAASKIIVVPADQAMSWRDSYSTWDLGLIAPLAARNNPAHPALVLCAHDGDNAWSGGNSYYSQWVPQMAGTAVADGYKPTTIEQFMADFPPDPNDVVHVENGGWVFADGDFGSPSFINWNWPPSYTDGGGNNVVDPALGTSDKADNWRIIVATENRVKTAQQISGLTPDIDQVRDPGSFSGTPNGIELGWHYYLAGLDSGFVYYGCNGDECLRAAVAQSNAVRNVNTWLASPAGDTTPPTVFLPQRHPWNPGGTNFGVQYNYKLRVATNSDFWVWTYAYDVSGITNVSLLLRVDGTNPPAADQFKTYAGGPLTGPWQATNMTQRVTPPVSGVTPRYIADYYYVRVAGISNAFVDYYVSATDARGNTSKSPIQHVYVGAGNGNGSSTGGGGRPATVSPSPPVAGNPVTIRYVAAGGPVASANPVYLHLGWNHWTPVVSPDAAMTFNSASNWWQITVTVPASATSLDCDFNNGSGIWDNNNGNDWHFTVNGSGGSSLPAFIMDGAFDSPGYLLASNGLALYGALRGTTLYVATTSTGTGGTNDHFIFVSDLLLPAATAAAPWAKAGHIGVSLDQPFLAAESQNSYLSWFVSDAAIGWPCAKSPANTGALEGTLDLVAAFGSVPDILYLSAAAYQTADGGALVRQCPAGSGPDIDPNEFLAIPTAALRDSLGNGTFDLCDPARGFRILSAGTSPGGCRLSWAAMPGRAYQVQYADRLGANWSNLPAGTFQAGSQQMELNCTDAPAMLTRQRFYRIELLP